MQAATVQNNQRITKPLVMIVEDRDEILQGKVKGFRRNGCTVFGFTKSDPAIKTLLSSPAIDLLLTDIDLTGAGDDKSGVHLAQFIRDAEMDMVLCGYSSQFEDDQLSEKEKELFDHWYPKAALGAQQINEMFKSLTSKAIEHRKKRRDQVFDHIVKLRKSHDIDKEEYEQIRTMILNSDAPTEIEEILHEANYTLRILQPKDYSALSSPFLVWEKSIDEIVEIEVYNHSSLYSIGDNEAEAIDKLLELMQLFVEDEYDESEYSASANKLKKFLNYVFKD